MTKEFFHSKIFIAGIICLVAGSAAYGMTLVGTPGQQRQLQFDQRRVSDLQQIASAIDAFWQENKKLPESFQDLRAFPFVYIESVQDPETGASYEYRILEEKRYELCAIFSTDSALYEERTRAQMPFSQEQWNHGAGRACFAREIVVLKNN